MGSSETPAYTVRESARAKHVRLKMSPHDGLVVVVPEGYDKAGIPDLIREKRQWLKRAADRIERLRKAAAPELSDGPPERLSLRAIGEEWDVDYRVSDGTRATVTEHPSGRLVISGGAGDHAVYRAALRRWLIGRARLHLVPWLASLADEHGFDTHKVAVRCQKSRWGSCSERRPPRAESRAPGISAGQPAVSGDRSPSPGTISLNAKLLFLPQELVRYVLLHELCHTVHLNHSPRFWDLLREHDWQSPRLRRALRDAWPFVPRWLSAGD